MELAEIRSVFSQGFDLARLQALLSKLKKQRVECRAIETELKNIKSFLDLQADGTSILVLRIKDNLAWDFRLRKLVADYLIEHDFRVGLVALVKAETKRWLWTIVSREELSSYLLNCYSIPVGISLTKHRLQILRESLQNNNLSELNSEFGVELKDGFIASQL